MAQEGVLSRVASVPDESCDRTVGVVATDGLVGRRVRRVLEQDGFAAIVVLSADEPLAKSDAVVVCCALPPLERPTILAAIRAREPHLPVVVVLLGGGAQAVRKAVAAGAQAVVREEDVERALVPSIAAALAGQVCTPADRASCAARPVLSFREKQVLDLVARGLTNFEIAERLFLAESTVKTHLSTAFRKLDVRSRAEAAALILDSEVWAALGMSATIDEELRALVAPEAR